MCTISRFYCLVLIILAWIFVVHAHQGALIEPARLYLELAYHNPNDHSSLGWCDVLPHDLKCDVYFIICIWNANHSSSTTCDVARKRTSVFVNNNRFNLRGKQLIQLPLIERVPEAIKLSIEVWDKDTLSTDDHIITFTSDVIKLNANSAFEKVELSKIGKTYYNKEVSLGLWLKINCSTDYYGALCNQYCKTDFTTFHCGQDGLRICYPGFKGELCDKRDHCLFEPCATNAKCSNTDDGLGRICYCNGGSGPECYETSDICNPSPCRNGGICKKADKHLQQFICECPKHYIGAICSQSLSSCEATRNALFVANSATNKTEVEICLNGGICVDLTTEFGHYCQCTSGWKGLSCEIPDWTIPIVIPLVVLLLLLLTGLSILICWRIGKRKKPRPTIEVIHSDSSRTCYIAKPVSGYVDEIHTDPPKGYTTFQTKNFTTSPMDIRNSRHNESEYEYIVNVPPPKPEKSIQSTTSTCSPALEKSRNETEMSVGFNADVYEVPKFNSSDDIPRDANTAPLRLVEDNSTCLDDSSVHYGYPSAKSETNVDLELKDSSHPFHLPQLPVQMPTKKR